MGIRLKFLLLLLVFSILPLVAFLVFHQRIYQSVGRDIYEIARLLLLQTAARDLQATAGTYADNIRRELHLTEALVKARLMDPEALPAVASSDLQNPASLPSIANLRRALAVLFDEVAVLRRGLVELEVSFPDGTSVRYPANSPFGADQNPVDAAPSVWTGDNPSASTWVWPGGADGFDRPQKPAVVTLCLPWRARDGSLRAVLLAGFDMLTVLETARPSSQWSPYMQTSLLRLRPNADPSRGAPLMIATRRPISEGLQWQFEMAPFKVAPEDSEMIGKLFQGSFYGREGYVSFEFGGEASLIAYAEVGEALGIVDLLPQREVLYRIARHPQRLGRWLIVDSILAAGAVIVVLVLMAAHRSRRMLDPFFSMIAAFNRVSAGDLTTRLSFEARDERRMVAEAFNQMVVDLEKGFRSRQALEVAHEVQHNFLPETSIALAGLDIVTRIRYCEETGGDYIDILRGKEGRVAVVVGDVTGHGVGAALLMATARALIRGSYASMDDLAALMDVVNRNLCADIGTTGRFVTLFALEIDLATYEMAWVRAGHDPAWRYSARSSAIHPLGGGGIALGVDPSHRFTVNHGHRLEPGDVALIGTDGLWETTDPEGGFFGKGRIKNVLANSSGRTATEIGEIVLAAVDRFRGDQKLADDVSLAVVRKT
jgi:sigma-B regulation protein RsbU (phosphoserine phosphatase)